MYSVKISPSSPSPSVPSFLVKIECYSSTELFVPLLLVFRSKCNYAAYREALEPDPGEIQAPIQMRKGFPEAQGKPSTVLKPEDFLYDKASHVVRATKGFSRSGSHLPETRAITPEVRDV